MIETYTSFGAIDREWEGLAERVDAAPFLRPGWLERWWRAYGGGSPRLLIARRDGRLVGVLPLLARGSVVESMTNWHTPEFAAVAEDEPAVHELVAGLFALSPRRAGLWFLNAESRDVRVCYAAAAGAGYRAAVRALERPPYVSINGSWREFESSLGAKMRGDLRRRWRLLEKEGRPEVQISDGRNDLDALLADGFRVEGSGWKDKAGTAIACEPETLQFYSDAAAWLAERGWLRLAFLRLDNRPIAFEYGVQHGGVYYFLKGGYDVAFGRFSPAKLLIRAALEHAFAAGLQRFDFGGSEEPFKLEWANGRRELVQFEAFAPSALGQLERAAGPVRRYGPVAVRRLKQAVTR